MNDLIRTENLLGGNKTIVGSPNTDLILESLGKVYVKYGKSIQLIDKVIKGIASSSEESIVITSSNDIEYPGDGKLIYNTTNSLLSICIDGQLIPLIEASGKEGAYVKKTGDRMSGTLYLDNKKPLNVTSTSLIQNLNSEYVGGYKEEDLAKKHEDEIIDGRWTFDELQRFKKKVVIDQSIGTDLYQDGYQGFGWRIDSKSNTLTIDNIIVRKAMYVYELVVNKIRATNGTLWITNSATLEEAFRVSDDLNSASWHFSEDRTKVINKGIEYLIHTKDNEKLWTESINYVADYLDYKDKLTEFESTGTYSTYNIYNKFFANSTGYYVVQTDETVFLEGDLLRCQKVINHGIKYYEAVVITTISFDQYLIQLSESSQFYTDIESGDELDMFPQKTDVVVQFGNIFNKNRQGSFFITSTEENSPYAMVIADCNRPNYNEPYVSPIFKSDGTLLQVDSKYKYEWIKSVKVRLGKLDKQWDNFYLNEFGESTIKGWGLYGQDVYLTGEFHLNNGQTIVDFAQDGILLKFKNAGLEIKDIIDDSVQPQNGWIVQMYPQYADSSKIKDLDPRLLEFEEGIPKYYTHLGVKYTLTKPGVYYQADCHLDEFNWFIMIQEGESKWNTGEQANKQGIILTADQVKIVNPKDPNSKSISMFYFDETGKAWFNTDMIAVSAIINKNTINSRYGFDSDGNFKDGDFTNPLWALYDNGNGLLAGGNIRWQTDGQLDIRGVIHANYGDISGMYLTASYYNDYYQYLRGKGLLLGNSTLILNNNFWDGANSQEYNISDNIQGDGQDHLQNISDMFNILNIDNPKNFEQWQLKMHYLKQRNYKQSSDSNFSKLLPYDNGILINNFGIKQKVNKQIFSYDSTILNITYSPVRFSNDSRYVFSADAAYNGYLNGAFIGVYNFIINDHYDGYKYVIIALDDVIDKNPELGSFLINGIKQGNISIRTNYQPILVLDENKVYKQPQNWYTVSEEDENAIPVNNGGYGQFSNWELQEMSWDYLDHNNLPNVGFYQGYKSNVEEYHKYRWTNGTEDYRYGLVGTNVTEIQVIKKPTDEFKNKNKSITNWINDTQKFYNVQPWHNLFTGLKFNDQSQMFSSLVSFRFQEKNNIVGEESPLKLNLNEDQFIFNCIYPEAITPINATGRVFDRSRFIDDYYYNMNYAQLFKGFPYNIQDIKGIWKLQKLNSDGETYSNYTLQQSDLYETINNYIKIAIGDDSSSNYGGFSLQIVYNE